MSRNFGHQSGDLDVSEFPPPLSSMCVQDNARDRPFMVPADSPAAVSSATFTRWADSRMDPLVCGQRITITWDGESQEYRVTDVRRDELNGHETYTLVPAEHVSNADPSDVSAP